MANSEDFLIQFNCIIISVVVRKLFDITRNIDEPYNIASSYELCLLTSLSNYIHHKFSVEHPFQIA